MTLPGGRPGPVVFVPQHHEAGPHSSVEARSASFGILRATWALPCALALLLLAPRPAQADCPNALTTAAAIQSAMKNAAPGTTILIAPGTYVGLRSKSGDRSGKGHFYSGKAGTAENPIVLKNCDPTRPVILSGDSTNDGSYVLHLTGSHWVVEDIIVTNGTKGIMLDNANHNVLRRMEVHTTGDEAVHVRDGSSHNLLERIRIHDTGLVRPGYGEGIYVGSDSTATYEHAVIGNTIRSAHFSGGVDGEHIDIKEGAEGTIVEFCIFEGSGMSGAHFADSFIDVKGVNSTVRHNVGYRRGNEKIRDGFQVRLMTGVYPSGSMNVFHDNKVDLEASSGVLLRALTGTVGTSAYANARVGGGKLYSGNIAVASSSQTLATDDAPGTATSELALSLGGFQPNPCRRLESVSFTLPSSGQAHLDIVDVAGRRVFGADVGSRGPGRHVLSGAQLPRLAPGVYLVTLVQGDERRTTRGVILD